MRVETIDAYLMVNRYRYNILRTTIESDARAYKNEAFFEINTLLVHDKITKDMRKFLKRKIISTMVEAGFRDSDKYSIFGYTNSKRYTRIYF